MKFRPTMQLRLRSVGQFEDIQARAKSESTSVNEWVLLQIEKANPGIVLEESAEPKKVKPRAKSKPETDTETQSTRPGCKECGAVGGLHQRGCPVAKKG